MSQIKFEQPSVMTTAEHFARAPSANIQRSKFNRSHRYLTTMDAGFCVPILVDEVLPGDTKTLNARLFARLSTPLHPIMDNISIDTHYFFVPNRLVWENWPKFMGERVDPADDPDTFTMPQRTLTMPTSVTNPNLVSHYFGLPMIRHAAGAATLDVNALPFRCYQLIWNEWYRDQNIQDSVVINKTDSNDVGDLALLPRGKRHDYFTSVLPWPQKGDSVLLPLGALAPVITDATEHTTTGLPALNWRSTAGVRTGTVQALGVNTSGQVGYSNSPPASVNTPGSPTNLYADLALAAGSSVNDVRLAFALQQILEVDARSGTRYIEQILGHFNVKSSDQRLQRPEFLGGGTSRVSINPVAATSESSNALGDLGGVGTSIGDGSFQKSFEEHGWIIGIASARADLTYQQGIDKMWLRTTKNEHYFPSLAHLGEQAVLSKELYYDGQAADNDVFGYQERFAEYRFKNSRITGLFNSAVTSSLDAWHLSQDFAARPVLNPSFIEEQPPIDRTIAVPTEPHFLVDIYFHYMDQRPMPVHGIPGLNKL